MSQKLILNLHYVNIVFNACSHAGLFAFDASPSPPAYVNAGVFLVLSYTYHCIYFILDILLEYIINEYNIYSHTLASQTINPPSCCCLTSCAISLIVLALAVP